MDYSFRSGLSSIYIVNFIAKYELSRSMIIAQGNSRTRLQGKRKLANDSPDIHKDTVDLAKRGPHRRYADGLE